MAFRSTDPATDEVLEGFAVTSPDGVERVLARAASAAITWRAEPVGARAERLRAAARLLGTRAAAYARIMAREMGKPVVEGEGEIAKCAWVCEFYAEHAAEMLAPESRSTDATKSYLRFDPLGTVLAIMPWNFPFWQVFRSAVPTLAAGNTMILKHAANVSRCALEIAACLDDAGFPEGAFQVVLVEPERVEALIADPRVHAVTLTGSPRAGRVVAAAAGRALKKSVLELGGSDAFVVLEDADVAQATRVAAAARLVNGGQSCIAAKRFIVVDAVAERFVDGLTAAMRACPMGNPLERATRLGPLARRDLRQNLHRQVQASLDRGARLALGGVVPDGQGAFYPPTVLTAVEPGMAAFDEETFGPVAAVIRARDDADAVRLANASPYGLGASLWTRDTARAERLAARLEAGSVFVNAQVHSDPRLPFGGIKESGYGRELSEFGMREFVNVKTVSIA